MTIYTAHFRYRTAPEVNVPFGWLTDTYVDIHAKSKAEATRIAKGMEGEDDKTWFQKIINVNGKAWLG